MIPFARIVKYGNEAEPLPVYNFDRPVQSSYTTSMILIDNVLYGYGTNTYGQLGIGANTAQSTYVLCHSNVAKYYLGTSGTILIGRDKRIYWAGRNTAFPEVGNQYGWYDVTSLLSTVNVTYDNIKDVQIGESVRILTTDGRFIYTGRNGYAECGVPAGVISTLTVSTLTGINSIIGMINGTHFIMNNGNAYYCGASVNGEGGSNNSTVQPPALVTTGVKAIGNAYTSSQWIKTDGTVYYSGFGGAGALASGNTTSVKALTKNTTLAVIDVSDDVIITNDLGNNNSTPIMLRSTVDGVETLRIVGGNPYGNIGNGTKTNALRYYTIPLTAMGGISNIKGFSTAYFASFILTKDNKLYATGGATNAAQGLPNGTNGITTWTLMANMPWY